MQILRLQQSDHLIQFCLGFYCLVGTAAIVFPAKDWFSQLSVCPCHALEAARFQSQINADVVRIKTWIVRVFHAFIPFDTDMDFVEGDGLHAIFFWCKTKYFFSDQQLVLEVQQ